MDGMKDIKECAIAHGDNTSTHFKDEDKKVCALPFRFCEIGPGGDVNPCCGAYCKGYTFGNVKKENFNKVWKSKKAELFRGKILEGDYSLCDMKTCGAMSLSSIKDIKEKYYDKNGKIKPPDEIKMSWDTLCNAACIICRDDFKKNTLKEKITQGLISFNLRHVFKKLKIFNCSGGGDPFGSKYCRNLLKKISKLNPDLKFYICSNGVLMSEDMCRKLGIYDRITGVTISLHAAKKETYDKIVRFGNFDKVIQNLKWLSDKKNEGKIGNINMVFVVNNLNYKEIPDFIDLCHKYGVRPAFSLYRYWGTEYGKDPFKTNVWDSKHPEYQEFLEVLKNPSVQNNKQYFTGFEDIFKTIKDIG